jgi:hypothetical protein
MLLMETHVAYSSCLALAPQHLPFLWLSVVAVGRVVGLQAFTRDFPFVFWAFVISWAYLRFHQPNPDGSLGDISEDFAFVTLFPAVSPSSP